jgi:hypothetical protein
MDKNPYPDQDAMQVELETLVPWTSEMGEHSVADAGITRTRGMGYGKIFGIPDLRNITFGFLAAKVALAYNSTRSASVGAPTDPNWLEQFKYLKLWVDRGVKGIYDLVPKQPHERFIRIIPHPDRKDTWILREGHHRSLAIWILGERSIWAVRGVFPGPT